MKSSAHVLSEPFSESMAFIIQDLFLTNGVHYIQVPHVHTGRRIMYTFLRHFSPYKKSACLSVQCSIPVSSYYATDIYDALLRGGYLNSSENGYNLDGFFYDQCHYDFMWIEKSWQSANSSLAVDGSHVIDAFEHMIIAQQLEKSIPIIIVHYGE